MDNSLTTVVFLAKICPPHTHQLLRDKSSFLISNQHGNSMYCSAVQWCFSSCCWCVSVETKNNNKIVYRLVVSPPMISLHKALVCIDIIIIFYYSSGSQQLHILCCTPGGVVRCSGTLSTQQLLFFFFVLHHHQQQ